MNLITGVELALIAVLADANRVKKSVDMKTKTIAEINRSEMCSMLSLFLEWIVVGRQKLVSISSYHRISTEEMPYIPSFILSHCRKDSAGLNIYPL
jgi:hypothetical protein